MTTQARLAEVAAERDALQAFKAYVHQRLDEAGIEKEPNGEHSKAGCRVGDRLDLTFARANAAEERAATIRQETLEEAAKVVDYEFDRLWKEIYGRSGNAGVTKMRTQPLQVVAEQIRALSKPKGCGMTRDELIEKIARAIVTVNLWGKVAPVADGSVAYQWLCNEVDRCWPDYVDHARAALAVLAKPENVTPEMAQACNNTVSFPTLEQFRKGIAAAIGSLLQEL